METHFRGANGERVTGKRILMNDPSVRARLSDTLDAASAVTGACGWDDRECTLFRLPLRTKESELGDAISPAKVREEVLLPFVAIAERTLLFTRHVRRVTVYEHRRNGARRLVSVTRTDTPGYRTIDTVTINAEGTGETMDSSKYCIGKASPASLKPLAEELTMSTDITIAIPPRPMSNCHLYCLLPILGIDTQLPFFIDAPFVLKSDRSSITIGEGLSGRAAKEVQWNKAMLLDACPLALERALMLALRDTNPADAEAVTSLYSRFPDPVHTPSWAHPFLRAFWGRVAKHPLVSDTKAFCQASDVVLLPSELSSPPVVDEVRRSGVSVVSPDEAPPLFMRENLARAGRSFIHKAADIVTLLKDAHMAEWPEAADSIVRLILGAGVKTLQKPAFWSLKVWPVMGSEERHALTQHVTVTRLCPPGIPSEYIHPSAAICIDETGIPLELVPALSGYFSRLTAEEYLQRVMKNLPKPISQGGDPLERWQIECIWLYLTPSETGVPKGRKAPRKAKRQSGWEQVKHVPKVSIERIKSLAFVSVEGKLYRPDQVYDPEDAAVRELIARGAECSAIRAVLQVPDRHLTPGQLKETRRYGLLPFTLDCIVKIARLIDRTKDVNSARHLQSFITDNGHWPRLVPYNNNLARLRWLVQGDKAELLTPTQCTTLTDAACSCFGLPTKAERLQDSLGELIDIGEACGQHEDIADRIKELIVEYPVRKDIFKELLQNARDAGASRMDFIIDRRDHPNKGVISPQYAGTHGPALVAYDNALFQEQHWQGITKLGVGSKRGDITKIGTYGLGFSSVFGLTDVPSILSGGTLLVLDPLRVHVPGATQANPGRKFRDMEQLLSKYPDMLHPFSFPMLQKVHHAKGALIRMPLRTEKQATESRLLERDGTVRHHNLNRLDADGILGLVEALGRAGAEDLVVFLERMQEVHFHEVARNGKATSLLSITRTHHKGSMIRVTKTIKGDKRPVESIYLLQSARGLLPNQSIVVAAKAKAKGGETPALFVTLPTGTIKTGLPIYISGTFVLTSNRKSLADSSQHNDALMKLLVQAYCDLIHSSRETSIIPRISQTGEGSPFREVASLVLSAIHKERVLPLMRKVRDVTERVSPADAVFMGSPSPREISVAQVLAAAGLPIVRGNCGFLPSEYQKLRAMNSSLDPLSVFSPKVAAAFLKGHASFRTSTHHEYGSGPLSSLSSEKSLCDVLEYVANGCDDLTGLPLLPIMGGAYTAWPAPQQAAVSMSSADHQLLRPVLGSGGRHILSPFAPLPKHPVVRHHTQAMSVALLAEFVKACVGERDLSPAQLNALWTYVGEAPPGSVSALMGLPVVPTSFGLLPLRKDGRAPVLVVESKNAQLHTLLSRLRLPVLKHHPAVTPSAWQALGGVCYPFDAVGFGEVVAISVRDGQSPVVTACRKLAAGDRLALLQLMGTSLPTDLGSDSPDTAGDLVRMAKRREATAALGALKLLPIFPTAGSEDWACHGRAMLSREMSQHPCFPLSSLTVPLMKWSQLGEAISYDERAGPLLPHAVISIVLGVWETLSQSDRDAFMGLVCTQAACLLGQPDILGQLAALPFVPAYPSGYATPGQLLLPYPAIKELFFVGGDNPLSGTGYFLPNNTPIYAAAMQSGLLTTLGAYTDEHVFNDNPANPASLPFRVLCANRISSAFSTNMTPERDVLAKRFAQSVVAGSPQLAEAVAGLRLVRPSENPCTHAIPLPPGHSLVPFAQCVQSEHVASVYTARYILPGELDGTKDVLQHLGVETPPSVSAIVQHLSAAIAVGGEVDDAYAALEKHLKTTSGDVVVLSSSTVPTQSLSALRKRPLINVDGTFMRPTSLFKAIAGQTELRVRDILAATPPDFLVRYPLLSTALKMDKVLTLKRLVKVFAALSEDETGDGTDIPSVCLDMLSQAQALHSAVDGAPPLHTVKGLYGCDAAGTLVPLHMVCDVHAVAVELQAKAGVPTATGERFLLSRGFSQVHANIAPYAVPLDAVLASKVDFEAIVKLTGQACSGLEDGEVGEVTAAVAKVAACLEHSSIREALAALMYRCVSTSSVISPEDVEPYLSQVKTLASMQWEHVPCNYLPRRVTLTDPSGAVQSVEVQEGQAADATMPYVVACPEVGRVFVCTASETVPDLLDHAVADFIRCQIGLQSARDRAIVLELLTHRADPRRILFSFDIDLEEADGPTLSESQRTQGPLTESDAANVLCSLDQEYHLGERVAYGPDENSLRYGQVVEVVDADPSGVPTWILDVGGVDEAAASEWRDRAEYSKEETVHFAQMWKFASTAEAEAESGEGPASVTPALYTGSEQDLKEESTLQLAQIRRLHVQDRRAALRRLLRAWQPDMRRDLPRAMAESVFAGLTSKIILSETSVSLSQSAFCADPLFKAAKAGGEAALQLYMRSFLSHCRTSATPRNVTVCPLRAKTWVNQAMSVRRDLSILAQHGGSNSMQSFLAYQVAEMSIKAALYATVGITDANLHSHPLSELASGLPTVAPLVARIPDRHYVRTRYPNTHGDGSDLTERFYSEDDAKRLIRASSKVFEECVSLVQKAAKGM
ncbi:hypothetical protein KIPB_000347 [Kipferlia bialata]|uniref:Uncharacterized protein n=1 Tax=Kipferlia bialata TaxID=797122 RepID=A0A9K3CP33_9EUKA|nr:hypothetical protein KIPB_000347 [Kipferlia bialata]|eukprot:g347.t1